MDAATQAHIISQVGRLLDAEVIFENRKRQMGDYGFRSLSRPFVRPKVVTPPVEAVVQELIEPTPIPAVTFYQEKPKMSITGLDSGAFAAKLAEIRQRAADKRAQGLSKIDGSVNAGLAKLDAAADTVVSKVDEEIAVQIQEFATFGDNGGGS